MIRRLSIRSPVGFGFNASKMSKMENNVPWRYTYPTSWNTEHGNRIGCVLPPSQCRAASLPGPDATEILAWFWSISADCSSTFVFLSLEIRLLVPVLIFSVESNALSPLFRLSIFIISLSLRGSPSEEYNKLQLNYR